MPSKKALTLLIAFAVVFVFLTAAAPADAASKEKVLYSFKDNGTDGYAPYAGLMFDAAGNLYGTTYYGGVHGDGTVFRLSPGAGGWAETVLYNFCSVDGCADGTWPNAGLTLDAAGNLYGTTWNGGGASSYGTVFQLAPGAGNTWTETVLHGFGENGDGHYPYAVGLIFDAAGNLYGTTLRGSEHDGGTVFKLMPGGGGTWTETVLNRFGDLPRRGSHSQAGLIFDTAGNLYGTTEAGGAYRCGTVFKLTPNTDGRWTETVLHSFKGSDGRSPYASLIFDTAGNLYGTTYKGGAHGLGTVFKITPGANGTWAETVLHSFGAGGDGYYPYASLIFDAVGNLYGTTSWGGSNGNYGVVFQLVPGVGGKWKEKVLHSFGASGDGVYPYAGLIFDADGNLYGTTSQGGADNSGTVFKITP
jgi:uncharacterized repeat protein (TIGR03803 family)